MKKNKKKIVYFFVGLLNAAIDFVVYTILGLTIMKDALWLASIVGALVATVTGFFLHSKITWKERNPGKVGAIKFVIWSLMIAIAIKPALTLFFETWTWLYEFAFSISSFLHLPFSYDFIVSTGVFGFMSLVIMVLNFICYDRVVFGDKKEKERGEKVDMESVRESGEE